MKSHSLLHYFDLFQIEYAFQERENIVKASNPGSLLKKKMLTLQIKFLHQHCLYIIYSNIIYVYLLGYIKVADQ